MESKDWAELWQLNEQAKVALMMGQLTEVQMADAMSFHTLATFIIELNERLSKLDGFNSTTYQPLVISSIVPGGGTLHE